MASGLSLKSAASAFLFALCCSIGLPPTVAFTRQHYSQKRVLFPYRIIGIGAFALKQMGFLMRKLALALAAIGALTGSASAADMAARPMKAPPPPIAAVQSWTGLWISGGFGYGLMDIDHSVTDAFAPFPIFDIGQDHGGRGWLGKIGAGLDYQFAGPFGSWVVGAFADAQWSDIKGKYGFVCPGGCFGPLAFQGQLKNDWSWSVGGRIGLVALPGLLTYVNGGYTQAHFNQVNYINNDGPPFAVTGLVRPAETRDGWFLGGGTEYAISQLPGLFWKSEYRFSDYGNHSTTQLCTVAAAGCGPIGNHSIDTSRIYVQTVTTELVYRFNWGGPVVAKY
jgi:outer membrane immunogenic protein